MFKYFLLVFLFISVSPLQAKDDKKHIIEIQNHRNALLLEQKRLLEEVSAFQKRLQDLSELQQGKVTNIEKNKQELSKNLPLLVRFGRVNSIRLLVDPTTGQNTLRSIILIRAFTESLKRQMKQVQAELNDIHAISKDLEGQERAHVKLLKVIELQQEQLKSLEIDNIEKVKKGELERLSGEEDINTLLNEGRAALSQKERSANAATSSKKFPFRRLERPVSGKINNDKSAKKKFSPHNLGLVFETKKNAVVHAPSSGTIVFIGPFRDQGDILILDHKKEVFSVFMGIDKINAHVGQTVYAGEKIGTMAGYGSGSPKLYYELRQKGKALDPKPYFAD